MVAPLKVGIAGLGTVGADTPYNTILRTDHLSGARTHARKSGYSYNLWFPGMSNPTGTEMAAMCLDSERFNNNFNGLDGQVNVLLPQVVAGAGNSVVTYKYWRLRATSAFLGACGSATSAYFWKLGFYRDAATANADTYGISSNNYIQQYANAGYNNSTTPITAGNAAHMCTTSCS